MSTAKNAIYWAYNLPLQYWPGEADGDARILNYMPRKERVQNTELELGDQTHEEFFNTAADKLENMAKLFRKVALNPKLTVYYHDEDPDQMEENT